MKELGWITLASSIKLRAKRVTAIQLNVFDGNTESSSSGVETISMEVQQPGTMSSRGITKMRVECIRKRNANKL